MTKKSLKRFYAVRAGRKVGIYTTWDDCKHQVIGHCGAIFKGFGTLAEAQQFMNEGQASTQSWPVIREAASKSEPEPQSTTPKAPPDTPTPATHTLRLAALNSAPKTTINGLRASQATPALRPEVGSHHRVNVLKKDAIKAESPGCYFEKFGSQEQKFKPDVKAEFSQEFDRLASSQGWMPGSQQYKTERVTALTSQVWTHFFKDALKEEDTKSLAISDDLSNPTKSIFPFRHLDPLQKLRGFQAMCRAVGREPGGTLEQCKMILKGTLVNIIDLIDASRTNKSLEVWTDFQDFKSYTLSNRAKTIPLDHAKDHEVLSCFLQTFSFRGEEMYEALYAKLRASEVGLPLNQATRSSSNSRSASPSFESDDDDDDNNNNNCRFPISSPVTSPCPAPKIETGEDTSVKTESFSSRRGAVVAQQDTEHLVTTKRERSESPVFLFEQPCKKRLVTPASALAKDIQSSLQEWPKFSLTQETDW